MNSRVRSVLIIDDCVESHELYRSLLAASADLTFEISVANTGREGLAELANRKFDCVLLDYRLPDVDGISVLRKLKVDLKNNVPVIMVTGEGHERVAVNALKAGASDYLTKGDLTIQTLRDAIVAAIQRQRDSLILGEARDVLIVKQQNVIDRQKRQLQAIEVESMSFDKGYEIH